MTQNDKQKTIFPQLARTLREEPASRDTAEWAAMPNITHKVIGRMPRPFDITALTETSITVTRLYYQRGPVFESGGESPISLALSGTDVYVCARINTQDGTVSLSSTPDYTDPSDASEFINIPLYQLHRTNEDSAWVIQCDFRGMAVVLRV